MIRSIATVSIGGALDEKLKTIAAAGFDAVEIFENDFTCFDGSARDVARMCGDLGLRICALQPFRDFEGLPEPQRNQAFRRAEKKFDLMGELGTDLLLVCSNVSPLRARRHRPRRRRSARTGRARGQARPARRLRGAGLGPLCQRLPRRLGNRAARQSSRHRHHPRQFPYARARLSRVARSRRSPPTGSSWSSSRTRRSSISTCCPGAGTSAASPDRATFPSRDFMRAVEATGYNGPLSLEIFNDQFRAQSTREVAVDAHALAGADGQRAAKDAARACAARANVSDTHFIEFAVDRTHAAPLAGLLRQLGFGLTGRHRSKAVERWSQGDINLLINSSDNSFAQSHYLTHGSGVCAIALEVDDVAAMMSRADALQATTFRQPVGPGEMTIPAIRGVGGSLLYFLEPASPNWDVDFVAVAGEHGPGFLRHVDHISQSMRFEEMLSWEQFYTGLFDVAARAAARDRRSAGAGEEPGAAEHGGLAAARAQRLDRDADHVVAVSLGVLRRRRPAHRVCLRRHLQGRVRHARGRRDVPDHSRQLLRRYRQPLRARSRAARSMKENGILYDRDDAGEFFQIYTHAFEERFFFEIVQRRGYKRFRRAERRHPSRRADAGSAASHHAADGMSAGAYGTAASSAAIVASCRLPPRASSRPSSTFAPSPIVTGCS